ncbi:MAG: tryptophan synthase subunit alpha [Verrucomicrobiota bacterium]|nr:tryptophan synthase subunit alpha [Verrucomicrobiota bacterium]
MSHSANINKVFTKCHAENRLAFVAYIAAGDPDFQTSLKIVDMLVDAGIDILELGVPFGDPLADGQANQLASQRALESGMTVNKILDFVDCVRQKHPTLPIVLFTYLNPIAYGYDFEDFCKKACSKGVDSALLLDLPPDEGADYWKVVNAFGLGKIGLVAPTTSEDRLETICKNATDFIYYVSQTGVTGARDKLAEGIEDSISAIRQHTSLPIVVGFGISKPSHITELKKISDLSGVVVGSAIVKKVEELSHGKTDLSAIGKFVSSLTTKN